MFVWISQYNNILYVKQIHFCKQIFNKTSNYYLNYYLVSNYYLNLSLEVIVVIIVRYFLFILYFNSFFSLYCELLA